MHSDFDHFQKDRPDLRLWQSTMDVLKIDINAMLVDIGLSTGDGALPAWSCADG